VQNENYFYTHLMVIEFVVYTSFPAPLAAQVFLCPFTFMLELNLANIRFNSCLSRFEHTTIQSSSQCTTVMPNSYFLL